MVAQLNRIDPTGLVLSEKIVDIWRCAKVVKGGRRFSFAAMTVIGNGAGVVGIGYGKAREVPSAIEKAVKNARKHLIRIPTFGTTLPHEVRGGFGSARVVLIPARPGTGLIAGASVRQVLECIGIHDILTKVIGKTTNPKNVVKATLRALLDLRSREDVARLRGVELLPDPMLASVQKLEAERTRVASTRATRQREIEQEAAAHAEQARAKREAEKPKRKEEPPAETPLPAPEASASPDAPPPAEGGEAKQDS